MNDLISDQQCKWTKEIRNKEMNGFKNAYFQDWYPLSKSPDGLMLALRHSPVAFGGYISDNYFAYSSGWFINFLLILDYLEVSTYM